MSEVNLPYAGYEIVQAALFSHNAPDLIAKIVALGTLVDALYIVSNVKDVRGEAVVDIKGLWSSGLLWSIYAIVEQLGIVNELELKGLGSLFASPSGIEKMYETSVDLLYRCKKYL